VVHGDEKGLRLPPKLAPVQVVVVPIYKTDAEKDAVLAACRKMEADLEGIRVHVDDRDEKSPGFKFNEWEVKGVPVRIEIGPKDLEKKQAMLARRTTGAKEAVALESITLEYMETLLQNVHEELYSQAEKYLKDNTHETDSLEEMERILEDKGGLVWAPWDGQTLTANKIKDKTKATIRLLGDKAKAKGKKDILSGADATEYALFAKAY
jgi:prolyl-tRNA synthetase